MSSSTRNLIIRIILGIIFAGLGYILPHRITTYQLFGVPYLLETAASFALGALAIFVFPVLASAVQKWFTNLINATVQSTVSKATGKFLSVQMARLREQGTEIAEEENGQEKKKDKDKDIELEPPITLLDTSAIIDGRALDIVQAGFLSGTLVLPQFVLDELQHIADSEDSLKRNRGRRGLEILEDLKEELEKQLIIYDSSDLQGEVDQRLVKLAKQLEARLLTVDFNLNKIAKLADIEVLNVNELANALKTVVLPGEKLKISIIQQGKEKEQGVGYLEDGTMIVVEGGKDLVGKNVEVEVARVLQTAAGRMVFAELT